MPVDPYKELGVDKNADDQTIKQAYKKLARQNHPDTGGDAEKFKAISHAYSILKDPEKRSSYDQHGEEKAVHDQAYEMVASLFDTMLNKAEDNPPDFNILEEMRDVLKGMREKIKVDRSRLEKRVKKYERMLKRFKAKRTGENFFQRALEHKIRDAKGRIQSATRARVDAKRALQILDNFEWVEPSDEEIDDWHKENSPDGNSFYAFKMRR